MATALGACPPLCEDGIHVDPHSIFAENVLEAGLKNGQGRCDLFLADIEWRQEAHCLLGTCHTSKPQHWDATGGCTAYWEPVAGPCVSVSNS